MPPSEEDGRNLTTPAAPPSLADTTPEDAEAEMAALCAAYEERRRLHDGGECLAGCDSPDGPLSPSGCPW